MRGTAGEGLDALFLVHAERGAHQRTIVEVVHIEDAPLTVEEFTHIAGEIHHRAVLDGGDRHLLDVFDRQVHVGPVVAVIDVAVVVDLVELVILPARIVHQHHIVALQILTDILRIERLWGIFLRLHRIALGILACPSKLRGWLAKVQHQHAIDGAQHLCLTLA